MNGKFNKGEIREFGEKIENLTSIVLPPQLSSPHLNHPKTPTHLTSLHHHLNLYKTLFISKPNSNQSNVFKENI